MAIISPANKRVQNETVLDAYSKIHEQLASVFHENVPLLPVSKFMLEGKHLVHTIWGTPFYNLISQYYILTAIDVGLVDVLNVYLNKLLGASVRSVEELVEWNKEHAEEALPTSTSS